MFEQVKSRGKPRRHVDGDRSADELRVEILRFFPGFAHLAEPSLIVAAKQGNVREVDDGDHFDDASSASRFAVAYVEGDLFRHCECQAELLKRERSVRFR